MSIQGVGETGDRGRERPGEFTCGSAIGASCRPPPALPPPCQYLHLQQHACALSDAHAQIRRPARADTALASKATRRHQREMREREDGRREVGGGGAARRRRRNEMEASQQFLSRGRGGTEGRGRERGYVSEGTGRRPRRRPRRRRAGRRRRGAASGAVGGEGERLPFSLSSQARATQEAGPSGLSLTRG
jgi:hypothetical protein